MIDINELNKEIDDLQMVVYAQRKEIEGLKKDLVFERGQNAALFKSISDFLDKQEKLLHTFDPKVIKEMEKIND